jgi:hypothetical protein
MSFFRSRTFLIFQDELSRCPQYLFINATLSGYIYKKGYLLPSGLFDNGFFPE